MNLTLGTTSYIYPVEEDNLLYNVRELSKEFDFIQLLCFGKDYIKEIINKENLIQLANIHKENSVNFIVHLPLDLNLLSNDYLEKQKSLTMVKTLIEETEKYIPVANYIMHIDKCVNFKYPKIFLDNKCIHAFEETLYLLKNILDAHTNKICIENTSYDLTFFAKQLKDNNLNICLDIGHIYIAKNDLNAFLEVFSKQVKVIHLHGVNKDKDHLSLSEMSKERLIETFTYLRSLQPSQVTIIEVFNRKNLDGSLVELKNL